MQGESKNRRFIPYPYSDSIFVVIGEEFGFQGAAVLLLLYFLFIYRMIMIAFQCYDLTRLVHHHRHRVDVSCSRSSRTSA